jgi:hypothetical protein
MVADRSSLVQALESALTAADPAREMAALLRAVLVSEPRSWEVFERDLVRRVVERLDTVKDDEDRLVNLAKDVKELLERASSMASVDDLLEVVAERHRFQSLIEKYIEGTVSRTAFLAYVAEQRWPREVRRRVEALPDDALPRLLSALQDPDVPWLEQNLVA